jgi:small subunit ribosomal protein S2
MKDITLNDLLKAGAHFGHQTSRWNPKMAPYIYTVRNDIYILDLGKTRQKLVEAMEFVRNVAQKGGTVLFVGTKRQAKEEVKKAALACGMPFVVTRWLGGTFTNFRTIQKTIKKMERYETQKANGEMEKNYTKKERLMIERELIKMRNLFEGIKDMKKLPEAVVILDVKYDEIALIEAQKSKVKIVGVVDTNSNPDNIDYVIPSNDDAIKVITLIAEALSEAISEGKKNYVPGASMIGAKVPAKSTTPVVPIAAAVPAVEAAVATAEATAVEASSVEAAETPEITENVTDEVAEEITETSFDGAADESAKDSILRQENE